MLDLLAELRDRGIFVNLGLPQVSILFQGVLVLVGELELCSVSAVLVSHNGRAYQSDGGHRDESERAEHGTLALPCTEA